MLKSGDLKLASKKLLDRPKPERSGGNPLRQDNVYRHVGFGRWEVASSRNASMFRECCRSNPKRVILSEATWA
jgi:hypothetical protein